ncbi:MAG: hypothetical protein PHH26_04855 [Candidatus Thermoplasmatota archaeon]|nr:hypothetical protein [Candidatus Thermoplasmatota archaeon]
MDNSSIDISRPLKEAKTALMSQGYICNVSVEDFEGWFKADMEQPDMGMDAVLKNPLLVVHEIVEINEVKKMGVTIAKDTIIGNPEKVDEAHIIAAEMELDFAMARRDYAHIKQRIGDFKAWCEDKRIAERLKDRYRRHYERALAYISRAEKHSLV